MKLFSKNSPLLAILCIGITFSFLACSKTSEDVSVTTYQVTNITSTSGTIRGTATVAGSSLTMSGIVFSTVKVYPTADTCRYITSATPSTDFTITLKNMSPDSMYHFRAFVRTPDSIYYGAAYSFKPAGISIDVVPVKGDTFRMGPITVLKSDTDNIPVHLVKLNDFSIGKYEVTNTQFALFLKSRCVTDPGYCVTTSGIAERMIYANPKGLYYDLDSGYWAVHKGYENLPVVNVTWYGANEFCLWAGGKLPTEAQWEFAARGGNSVHEYDYLYSGGNDLGDVAWYATNVKSQTGQYNIQVGGGKAPNVLGIYDMSGNASEWVFDWKDLYWNRSLTDPTGLTDDEAEVKDVIYKVRRGGSWADTDSAALRVCKRSYALPTVGTGSIGFRFAK